MQRKYGVNKSVKNITVYFDGSFAHVLVVYELVTLAGVFWEKQSLF